MINIFLASPILLLSLSDAENFKLASDASAAEILEKYCLPNGTVDEKAAVLKEDGWIDFMSPLKGVPETNTGFRTFTHQTHPQIIIITSPRSDTDMVRDCVVNDIGTDIKITIKNTVLRWGKPEKLNYTDEGKSELFYYWPLSKNANRALFVTKSMNINSRTNSELALVVRFGNSKFPTKEEINVNFNR